MKTKEKVEEKEEEKEGAFSLEDLLLKKPIPFSKKKQKEELDKEKLKQALRESLKNEKGEIKPNQTVKFE